jgi:integrase
MMVRRSNTSTGRRSDFGSVRELPSGRFRATYRTSGAEHTAPTTFKTKTDAKRYLASVRASIEKGTWSDPRKGRMTVKELGDRWLHSNPNKAPSTLARDISILGNHVYPKLGSRKISQVSRDEIQSLVNGWTGEPSSISRQYTCMSALFNFAELNEWIVRSPCRRIAKPRVIRKERYSLTPEDLAKLALAMGEDYGASVWIGAETGLRWNEIYGLRVGDLDLRSQKLTVNRGLTRSGAGASVIAQPGSTKSKHREFSISSRLCEVLHQHLDRLTDRSEIAWLFPDSRGGLVRYSNWLKRHWNPASEAAGLGECTPSIGIHDLRRLSITRMYADKVDSPVVLNRTGHTKETMSLAYAQPDADSDRRTSEALGSWIFSAMSHLGRTA